MTSPPDSFAAAFDAIELDPARAPSLAAIDAAMAMCAPIDEPGFYLLDDAGGRFTVDREWGLISLRDEATLERERGAMLAARLKVIEPSGETYELALRLRISGMAPQLICAEQMENEALFAVDAALPPVSWSRFAAISGACALPLVSDEVAPFVLAAAPCPANIDAGACALALEQAPPRASLPDAAWVI